MDYTTASKSACQAGSAAHAMQRDDLAVLQFGEYLFRDSVKKLGGETGPVETSLFKLVTVE